MDNRIQHAIEAPLSQVSLHIQCTSGFFNQKQKKSHDCQHFASEFVVRKSSIYHQSRQEIIGVPYQGAPEKISSNFAFNLMLVLPIRLQTWAHRYSK